MPSSWRPLLPVVGVIGIDSCERVQHVNCVGFLVSNDVGGFNRHRRHADIPASTALSKTISRDLKQRGFAFVGPVVVYSHMQATGLVNDHVVDCFRWRELA